VVIKVPTFVQYYSFTTRKATINIFNAVRTCNVNAFEPVVLLVRRKEMEVKHVRK
jgi:hypothetical protein